jgi:protein TonB
MATNTVPTQTENETSTGAGATRPNPVALEALVTVTGARPSSEGTRDLFTEETRTILVFTDGAVIQLTAPVSEGQLLFLTNKKSNEEVVCQVLHKRTIGASTCYVELQFTEQKPNYWGVAFPKGKKRGAEFTAAEQVAAEQTTEQDAGTAPPAHREKDVDDLKTHVEALRKQLAELEKRNAEEAAAKAAAERAAAEEHAAAEAALREAEEAKASAAKAKQELHSAHGATPTKAGGSASEALLMPAAGPEKKGTPGWTVPMALPTEGQGEARAADEKEVEAEPLPKPELDFSRVPNGAKPEELAARASMKDAGSRREKFRMAGLLVVLVAVGLGAYEKVAPYVSTIMNKTGSTATGATKVVAPKPAATPKETASSTAGAALGGSASGNVVANNSTPAKVNGPAANGVAANKDGRAIDAAPAAAAETKENAPAPKPPEVAEEMKAPVVKERAATKKSRTNETAAEPAPAELVPADAPVIPAKLLHAATPVYPPDAMRKYITGDVKAELVVGASGKVGEVKVVSGPNALRDAAVEALKRYEYEPATQGGKAVASKTMAVVKFWFNP